MIFKFLVFVKLVLKINNKFFEARVTSVQHVFFVVLRPYNTIFIQAKSNGMSPDRVRFSDVR